MGVPVRQMLTVASYLLRQKLAGRAKFPLIVELEPLFACNLACAGCGKIQHPHAVLKRRMSVEDAVNGIEECGAPMVSIAGGEPLIHPQIHEIVRELIAKKFVRARTACCCDRLSFAPSRFSWPYIDGCERHDAAVCEDASRRVRTRDPRGQAQFRVTTSTTSSRPTRRAPCQVLDFQRRAARR
jgi:hopanoid biosynthesis associated radical SAM protein HpnH